MATRSPRSAGRTTLADLAAELGLDKSSVSLALRGSPKVSRPTRERVVAAATRRGYTPNLAARQLSSSSAQLIALVLPGSFEALEHSVIAQAIQGLASRASANGMLFNIVLSEDMTRAASGDAAYPVLPDGLCVWGDVPAHHAATLSKLGRPMVVLDPSDASYASYDGSTVSIDNTSGGSRLADHLLERGATRLLVVQEKSNHLGQTERWQSARARWMKSNPVETLSYCLLDELTGAQLKAFCRDKSAAIMCTNDRAAIAVWHKLRDLGVNVPRKVRLTGFDGDATAMLIGLTTMRPTWAALGQRAFEILQSCFRSKKSKPVHATVPVELVEGKTT